MRDDVHAATPTARQARSASRQAGDGRVRRRGLWRRVAAALRHINAEQTLMWELSWQARRATVPKTGPLTWVQGLDGYRLAGGRPPTSDDISNGGTP